MYSRHNMLREQWRGNTLSQAGEKSAAQTALPKWAGILEVWGCERLPPSTWVLWLEGTGHFQGCGLRWSL